MSRIKDAFYDEAEKLADVRNITLEEAMELLVEGEVDDRCFE